MRETFPVLLGTLVSQTVLNLVALVLLGVIIVSTTDLFHSSTQKLFLSSASCRCCCCWSSCSRPSLMRRNGNGRLARAVAAHARGAGRRSAAACTVFRDPRRGAAAAAAQLGAWAIQLLACWALLAALGLDHQVGIGAAAAVLFAVNVTAVVPGDAVQHRRLPARRDQRPAHRLRRSAPPTRSPTASSCRRSRSPPPSRSACRPWSARASPGATCASGALRRPGAPSEAAPIARARGRAHLCLDSGRVDVWWMAIPEGVG